MSDENSLARSRTVETIGDGDIASAMPTSSPSARTATSVFCSCGAEWHGRYVETAADIIAVHANRDGLITADEFGQRFPAKRPRRPRRKRAKCALCGSRRNGRLEDVQIHPSDKRVASLPNDVTPAQRGKEF